ncbi:putative mRNA (guanine-N(7)-)-methyltransferase [Helianthus anomalus]
MVNYRFPFFGNKYQLKFANEASAETHCLKLGLNMWRYKTCWNFMTIIAIFGDASRSRSWSSGPRGSLLPKFYDILGLYTTFIFQKPDPDVAPPLMTDPIIA